jgi:uridine kinase
LAQARVGAGGLGRRRVILVTGPSGAGKSRLSQRVNAAHGWPVVRLDDFYREHHDPDLPVSDLGIPDWDHPDSWNAEAAVSALRSLVDTGRAQLPVYDIGRSEVTGTHDVAADADHYILAEGLFAARLVEPLRAEGLLADALCVCHNRWVTFFRRLVRDLAERRKSPHILLRRGWTLLRQEPEIIADAVRHGARAIHPHAAETHLTRLVGSTEAAA